MALTVPEGTSCGLVVAVNQKFTVRRRFRLRRGSTGRTSLALALGRKPSAPGCLGDGLQS